MNKKTGFTFIEFLIIISIITIISSFVIISLSSFRDQQVLKNTVNDITSLLNKARQNTLASVNSNNYGVHFDTDKAVLFVGPTYSSGAGTNEINLFSNTVSIPTSGGINLGGGSDVVFNRLTAETISGTIIVRLKSDATKQKTITINTTGIINSD